MIMQQTKDSDNQMTARFKETSANQKMSVIASQFIIKNNASLYKKKYPTGFVKLDNTLNGGLTAGLHCIGAISSLGKSTFAMQIANHVAQTGNPVIIFSLEMEVVDLTAKAVSRQTFIDTPKDPHLAKSSDMLRSESIASKFSDQEWNVISSAAEKIAETGENITLVGCGAEPYSVEKIYRYVETYIDVYDKHPFIVVDYLQILDPPEKLKSASDKQIADYNLKRLKVLSDYNNLPIIIISSFNRENYDAEVSFRSFKDSGNIEYSCDTVIGLQLKGTGASGFNVDEAKQKYPRDVELKILKQRYGQVGQKIEYKFYTIYNFFDECINGVIRRDYDNNEDDGTLCY
ncbi:DnaB-like helicase C-terminal domain-containing protein [Anaerocolumna xylanovorans]|uniref:DnaB-like helicase C terminal domain-containing protein n=1 Tax=Anaerocolumna xylanovorans DSM 12503 TaxID=1121345 RepID=A0A1M7YLC0_9FIRM|nr:DnaB-like helicase C-terminal domain-containing protein [Anaerocolumna xylanovorans]SHO53404.1 DnaB-like helicase C terminal domain-containing protein [Anaerocolumna xylanovorans DSM 12503]